MSEALASLSRWAVPAPSRAQRSVPRGSWIEGPADAFLHQAVWWACVLPVLSDTPRWAPLAVALYALLHAVARPAQWPRLAGVAVASAGVGWVVDTTLARTGAIEFSAAVVAQTGLGGSVLFMVALWTAFGLSLTASLRWLQRLSLPLVGLIGAVAGPIAYLGGETLGLLSVAGTGGYAGVGVGWAVAVATLSRVARPSVVAPVSSR